MKQQYIAADAYKRDGTAAIAGELNEWIAVGDWTLYVTFPQKVQQVTAADVQRVAKKYLNEIRVRRAGSFRCRRRRKPRDATLDIECIVLGERRRCGQRGRPQHPLADRGHRCGHLPHRREGRGGDSGSLPAGDAMAEPGNIAIPTLTGMMLDRGTTTLDKFAIAEQLDDVGAEIAFSVGAQSVEIRAKCLKKDLPLIVGLIAGELRTPPCNRRSSPRPSSNSSALWRRGAEHRSARTRGLRPRDLPPGHPNRRTRSRSSRPRRSLAGLDELKAFHAKYYGPAT